MTTERSSALPGAPRVSRSDDDWAQAGDLERWAALEAWQSVSEEVPWNTRERMKADRATQASREERAIA